jgi:hypothetical protein
VLVEQELGLNPFGSALYVFINRGRNKIKVLYWHRNGFCLWLKLLASTQYWPAGDADKILDYLGVVHVFIRRAPSGSKALPKIRGAP